MSAEPRALIHYLPMEVQHLKHVIEIENRAYPHPWTLGNFRDSIHAGHRCVLCCYGDVIIAYAVVMIAADEAHLLNLTVAIEWQGKGHGRALLLHLLSIAIMEFARTFLLEVRPSNEAAQRLYTDLGFHTIGVRRGYYPAQIGREDAIVMELKL